MKSRIVQMGVIAILAAIFAAGTSIPTGAQTVEERLNRLEQQVQQLQQAMKEATGASRWAVTPIHSAIEEDFEDFQGPDQRIVMYLNGVTLFDTSTSAYAEWFNVAGADSYTVHWVQDIPILETLEEYPPTTALSPPAPSPMVTGSLAAPAGQALATPVDAERLQEQARQALTTQFAFQEGDSLVVELLDRDLAEDELISRWRLDNPRQLTELTDKHGSLVKFEVERL